jgi:hypothetical protein
VICIQCYRWRQDHMVVAFFSVNRLHFFERPPACSGMTTSQVICQVWSPYEPSSIRPRARRIVCPLVPGDFRWR